MLVATRELDGGSSSTVPVPCSPRFSHTISRYRSLRVSPPALILTRTRHPYPSIISLNPLRAPAFRENSRLITRGLQPPFLRPSATSLLSPSRFFFRPAAHTLLSFDSPYRSSRFSQLQKPPRARPPPRGSSHGPRTPPPLSRRHPRRLAAGKRGVSRLFHDSFTWLDNDREKDRTFRLKEYRHVAIARLQRRHRETFLPAIIPPFTLSRSPPSPFSPRRFRSTLALVS